MESERRLAPAGRRAPLICAALALFITGPAPAATPAPGQIERQFEPLPEPKSTLEAPPAEPPAEPPAPAASELRFTLQAVELRGMKSFSASELAPAFNRLIGREVTLSELKAAAGEITVRYRNAGHLLSQAFVPAQTVEAGKVRIEIVEGHIDGFVLTGTTQGESPIIAELANRIVAERPVLTASLERDLLLMNDLGGHFVRGTLVPSPDVPGAATLFLDLSRKPVSAGIAADNRGGRQLGPWRTNADVEAHGLLSAHDRTALRFTSSWNDKLNYLQLQHEQPLGVEGKRLGLALSAVRAEPPELFFIPLNIETSSDALALSYLQPIVRSRRENLSWRANLTAHNGKTKLFGFTESEDRVRSLRLGFSWDAADALAGVSLIDLEYSHGISGLGSSHNGDALLSRANGRVDYRKLTLYAARVQSLAGPWSALLALSAQRAMTDLLSSELYSFGGEQFGRGFDPSELVGDHGAAAKLELRYGRRQPLSWLDAWSLYAFYDAGMVRQRTPTPGSERTSRAQSTGIGSRFDFGHQISSYLELAKPIGRDVAAENDRHARAYFGLSVRY